MEKVDTCYREKDPDYRRMITSARWHRLRRAKLTQDPLCEDCLARGRYVTATEVHHVRPVESASSYCVKEGLMFDIHNLRSLCHRCHVEEHKAFGRSGSKAHTAERTRERVEAFRKRFELGVRS